MSVGDTALLSYRVCTRRLCRVQGLGFYGESCVWEVWVVFICTRERRRRRCLCGCRMYLLIWKLFWKEACDGRSGLCSWSFLLAWWFGCLLLRAGFWGGWGCTIPHLGFGLAHDFGRGLSCAFSTQRGLGPFGAPFLGEVMCRRVLVSLLLPSIFAHADVLEFRSTTQKHN